MSNEQEKINRELKRHPWTHKAFFNRPHWTRRRFFELAHRMDVLHGTGDSRGRGGFLTLSVPGGNVPMAPVPRLGGEREGGGWVVPAERPASMTTITQVAQRAGVGVATVSRAVSYTHLTLPTICSV